MGYINLDFDGLGSIVVELIGGVEPKVDTYGTPWAEYHPAGVGQSIYGAAS